MRIVQGLKSTAIPCCSFTELTSLQGLGVANQDTSFRVTVKLIGEIEAKDCGYCFLAFK